MHGNMVYGLSALDQWTYKLIQIKEFIFGYVRALARLDEVFAVGRVRLFMEIVFFAHDASAFLNTAVTDIRRVIETEADLLLVIWADCIAFAA
jgi:hypothetical protein